MLRDRRMATIHVLWLLALTLGCRRSEVARAPQEDADPVTRASRPDAGPPPAAAMDPARSCGEAGPTATPMPAALFDGMRSVGDADVGPGQTVQVGGVQARYDTSAWIGTMETGHRGAALQLLIDRAVAGPNMPWGDHVELGAGRKQRSFIGPYRIDVTASGEDPPQRVGVHVDKRACPDHAVILPSPGPIWMWASTEAIRLFTVDLHGQMLQVGIDARPDGPRVEVNALGWRQTIFPRPGVVYSARIDGRLVTIDAVEPGRGTRFDGTAWHADQGTPRVSIRARVEPAAAAPPAPAATGPAIPCGAAAAGRTTLPAELSKPPRAGAEVTLGAGQKRQIAGIELTASALEVPARPGRGQTPERILIVSSPSLVPSSASFGGSALGPGPARAERAMVLFEAMGAGSPPARVRARAFALPCPRSLALPVPGQPQHLWLSTIGHGWVTVGPPDRPALTLQVSADDREASLLASSENAYDSRRIGPELVGHVVTMDGLRLEVTDVVIGAGTALFPIAHVQVRITGP